MLTRLLKFTRLRQLLSAYLLWLPTALLAQNAMNGFQILGSQRSGNCTACHSIPDASGKKVGIQSTFAPALDGVGTRYNSEQLRQWVTDARVINAKTLMPPFGVDLNNQRASGRLLTDAQIADVVAALETLR
jgi:sulfur oxidation c-type cytochrome SoxX